MKWLVLFLSVITISACGGSSEAPCEWTQNKFYATVHSHEFNGEIVEGDSIFTVWVEFSSGSLSREMQDLGKLRNTQFTKDKIKANQAFKGNSFTGLINETEDGNCDSPIISFDQKLR